MLTACVVAPLFHTYFEYVTDVPSVSIPPAQKEVPPVMTGKGLLFTVTAVVDDKLEHPSELVTVTELLLEEVTFSDCVVLPLGAHKYVLPEPEDAAKVTEPP